MGLGNLTIGINMSITEEIEKLARLKESGHLTEEEFQSQKKKILEGNSSNATGQPTFVIQNSVASSSSAAASATVNIKKRSGCLCMVAKIIIGLFIFLFVVSLFSSSDKKDKNNKPESREISSITKNQDECGQSYKDTYYAAALHRECYINAGMPEFQKALILAGNRTIAYRRGLGCGISDMETQDSYQEQVTNSISDMLNKAGSLKEFCQGELPYFNQIVRKYGA